MILKYQWLSSMGEWKIRIKGDKSYISDLAKSYGGSGFSFEEKDGLWIVSGGWLLGCTTHEECHAKAEEWLNTINAVALILGGCPNGIVLIDDFFHKSDGGRVFYADICDTVHVSDSISFTIQKSDGTVEEYYPAKFVPSWIDLSYKDGSVKSVFELLASRNLSWVNIYRVFELVRADAGGERALLDRGWFTKPMLSRFTHSANHPEVSGKEARHGYMNNPPPEHPMELKEGQLFVKSLVQKWVENKQGGLNNPSKAV